MTSQSPRGAADGAAVVLHQPFDEGVPLCAGRGDELGKPRRAARRRQSHDLFEIAADPGQGAEQVIGLHVGAGLEALAQGGFADEARGLQASGLGTGGDVGKFLGEEPEQLGTGAAASGGHGRSEIAGRWIAGPSIRE